MHTEQELIRQIKALGILTTDTLVVHTALKSVGKIEAVEKRPAVVLIDALQTAVKDGLLLIPAFTYANVRETPVFDIRDTVPCIGGVPAAAVELANKAYANGERSPIRSLHPTHSVVAFGQAAAEYVADDAKATTPFPIFGSLGKMINSGGKLLFIGAPLSSNSFIHAVDEYLEPSGVHSHSFVTATDYEGNTMQRGVARCQGPAARYPLYEPYLREAGAITYGRIGDADAILIDARLCAQVVKKHRSDVNSVK